MSLITRIAAERRVATRVSEQEGIPFRKALNALREVQCKPADVLAAASGFDEATCAEGLLSEAFATACVRAAGVAIPVHAVGAPGDFLKWMFSDEGREAFFAFVKKLFEVFIMVLPYLV